MAINFCEKCKDILPPSSKEGSVQCPNCNLNQPISKKLIATEKMPEEEIKGEGVAPDRSTYATYENICQKCGFNKAEIIDLGVKYSDEDNLILLKCGKCGASERIGRKTS